MMRADALNWHDYGGYTKMTALPSNVNSTDEDKSKRSIINKTLLQNCSADEDELSSTKEDKSECAIKKHRDAKNEVPYDVTNYLNAFNLFECGRNILDRLDVAYERVRMDIQSTISNSAYFGSE